MSRSLSRSNSLGASSSSNPMSSPPVDNPALAAAVVASSSPRQPDRLFTPLDAQALEQPANIARPFPGLPRRMSISDTELLQRALAHAFSNDGALSRPATPERERRARTRVLVSTSGALGLQPQAAHSETFAIDFAPNDGDSTQMAIGCGDGSVRLFGASGGAGGHRLQRVLHHVEDRERLPATCVRFAPSSSSSPSSGGVGGSASPIGASRMLLAAYADGHVVQWRVGVDGDSGSVVRSLSTGASNSVYALAWQSDAKHFVAAGRDHVVRLYDANTGQLVRAFDNTGRHGHTNRIYALQWHPRDAHTLLSGGWDNTVQIWDDRTGTSNRSIFGPHICGDSLSLNSSGSEVLTGSWRDTDDALQRWDFGSGKLLKNISWKGEEQQGASSSASASATSASASSGGSSLGGNCMLYAASFSPDDRLIAAGGAGNGINQARLFDAATNTPVERVSFTHAIYALSFAPDSKQLALGGVDSHLTILTL